MDNKVEDVTKDYTKKEEVKDTKTNEDDLKSVVFDLDNKTDLENLKEETKSTSIYFKPEEDITYKVRLTTSQVKQVEKVFDNNGEKDIVTKYELGISALGSDKSEFEGIWEVGTSVINPILKNLEKDAVFNIVKTGTGKKTRYAVTKDF